MKSRPWIAVIAILSVTACNYTVGECWPVGQGNGSAGVGGGGVLLPGGTGDYFGDEPTGSGGDKIPEADCNSKPQGSAAPQMPATDYINCKARGLDAGACALACGEVGAACGAVAAHPYKSGQGTGQLTYCKNGWPSFTCTYTFASGDACVANVTIAGIYWLCPYTGGK